jgi:mxaJ protein
MSSRCREAIVLVVAAMLASLSLAAQAALRELRVCADPDNLPYSNRAGRGFENRIAELVAHDLGATVSYYWLPQWRGYARKTLAQHHCDLIPGIAQADDSVLATKAYYRGTYAFVYAPSRFPALADLDDPRLRDLRIGIQVIGIDATPSPAARALAQRGIVEHVVGFPMMGESPSASRIVDALANGTIDVGIVWSPQPGYFIAQRHLALTVVPIAHDARDPAFAFAIAMGVRRDDVSLQQAVNAALAHLQPEIDDVLRDYAVTRVDGREQRAAR